LIEVVNMIPRALSDEFEQDSEPSIAVNPADPTQIVGSAFTPDPFLGPLAPIYVSSDGGATWALHSVVPGGPTTGDISVAFATDGGTLYAGTLNGATGDLNVLRTPKALSPAPMTLLVRRPDEDQPWASAVTVTDGGSARDRVYMSHNNNGASPQSASVELSQDARTAAAPAGFATHVIEERPTAAQDGPPVRIAPHKDGTVYAAFQHWVKILASSATAVDVAVDIVVTRDDHGAAGPGPFRALTDPGDGEVGKRAARNRFARYTKGVGPLGQERIGGDLAIAVDPNDSDSVWIAWCDRVGGPNGTDWTMHVQHSSDRGETWSEDLHTITNAKNPALAVNDKGVLGLLRQQLAGVGSAARWVTELELTADRWATSAGRFPLHTAPASTPRAHGFPYIGDYIRLLTVGDEFYGAFSGSNEPNQAHFPQGVTYQRNADFATRSLLGADGASPVNVSIDPFFVHYVPDA
jgi:hypothetical protein